MIQNWIIKQLFYIKFLWLKRGKENYTSYPRNPSTFYSRDFEDGRWDKCLPWDTETKATNWNTYGIFNQQYGKFYFKVRLDGLASDKGWPAIWLFEMKSFSDVEKGLSDHAYYYEADIELFKEHFGYTVHMDHDGKGKTVERAMFASRKLYRELQSNFHLYCIDWNEKWIRYYIDGILSARFKNDMRQPMQIILSKLTMTQTIVEK